MKNGPQTMKAKTSRPVSRASPEFEAGQSLWRMEFGFHTFKAVREGIEKLLEQKLHSDEPEYYPMCVGLICLYSRPFTNNHPVGPLTEDIIPKKHLSLHRDIITMRHKLFAHGEPAVMTRPDDYPNELVFENNNRGTTFHMTRFLAEPEFFKLIVPLVETLIKKTRYHADRFAKPLNRYFEKYKNLGQFRLNLTDANAPIFSKLTPAEKATRESTIRHRNPSI